MTRDAVDVEVCVESLSGVHVARAAGARRIELCSALAAGGLTPGHGMVAAAVAAGGIEIVVLVRPRGGDFLHAVEERAVMERDVEHARALGAAGVALGCLRDDGEIDEPFLARLVERARPLAVTFHRAFDLVREPERALETLVRLGVARVLTSGQEASALEGRARIAALVGTARGRIEVVAAGGVRAENVETIVSSTGVRAVHLGPTVAVESAMRFRNPRPRLARTGGDEYAYHVTDAESVRAVVQRVSGLRRSTS